MGLRERLPGLGRLHRIARAHRRDAQSGYPLRHQFLVGRGSADPARGAYQSGGENGLYRCLDVTFGEDVSASSLCKAAREFSFPRRLATNMIRADTSCGMSLPNKRKNAARNPDYLAQVLGLHVI